MRPNLGMAAALIGILSVITLTAVGEIFEMYNLQWVGLGIFVASFIFLFIVVITNIKNN